MTYIDLSRTIEKKMSIFKGLPQPEIGTIFTHEESKSHYKKCTFEVSKVSFATSIGTYMDSPFHRHPGMDDISKLKLEQTILPGVLVDVSGKGMDEPITASDIGHADCKGKAVLIYTNWARYWKKEEYYNYPFLAKDAVRFLIRKGAKLVGIDVLAIDSLKDEERPAHTYFLKNNILIVENLCNLQKLKGKEFTFYACPLKVKGAAAFPVRAFAEVL